MLSGIITIKSAGGFAQARIHDADPCDNIQVQSAVTRSIRKTSNSFGMPMSSVKNSRQLSPRNNVRTGAKIRFPKKLMREMPSPQLTKIGSDISVITICVWVYSSMYDLIWLKKRFTYYFRGNDK